MAPKRKATTMSEDEPPAKRSTRANVAASSKPSGTEGSAGKTASTGAKKNASSSSTSGAKSKATTKGGSSSTSTRGRKKKAVEVVEVSSEVEDAKMEDGDEDKDEAGAGEENGTEEVEILPPKPKGRAGGKAAATRTTNGDGASTKSKSSSKTTSSTTKPPPVKKATTARGKKAKGKANDDGEGENDASACDAGDKGDESATPNGTASGGDGKGASKKTQTSDKMLKGYQEPDSKEPRIGPEGMEQLFTDLDLSMAGPAPLLLAWKTEATDMGYYSTPSFVSYLTSNKINSLHQLAQHLLLLEKTTFFVTQHSRPKPETKPKSSTHNDDSHGLLNSTAAELKPFKTPSPEYKSFYSWLFKFLLSPPARTIDIATASAVWGILLPPLFDPLARALLKFVEERSEKLKGVTKDGWGQVMEFCEFVELVEDDEGKKELVGWDEEGAWPTMIDDFAEWIKIDPEEEGAK